MVSYQNNQNEKICSNEQTISTSPSMKILSNNINPKIIIQEMEQRPEQMLFYSPSNKKRSVDFEVCDNSSEEDGEDHLYMT